MSWLKKWLECWWYDSHVPCDFYDKAGKYSKKCVRCGSTL